MTIRVVVADDQVVVREGFAALLRRASDIEVLETVSDGRPAVDAACRLLPDVVLMDVRMPVLDGIHATEELVRRTSSRVRVMVLTTFDLDAYVVGALRAGASGFLLKDVTADQLADAIRVVSRGDALLAPTVTRRLLAEFAVRKPAPHALI